MRVRSEWSEWGRRLPLDHARTPIVDGINSLKSRRREGVTTTHAGEPIAGSTDQLIVLHIVDWLMSGCSGGGGGV